MATNSAGSGEARPDQAGSRPHAGGADSPRGGGRPKRRRSRRKRSGGAAPAGASGEARRGKRVTKGGGRALGEKKNRRRRGAPARAAGKGRRGGPRRGGSGSQRERDSMPVRDETSAGGLVVSGLAEAVGEDGELDTSRVYVALIGRLDRRKRLLWSMPKGHVEPGEPRATTAEREVWEETGLSGDVFAEMGSIDYWFVSEGVRIHKTVHHHLLYYVDGILNDEDPEVTEVTWTPLSRLIERLAYADERRLARRALDRMPELARAAKREERWTPR